MSSPLDDGQQATMMNSVEIKAYKFFDSVTGREMVVKGVDYYPRPNHGPYDRNSMDFYTEDFRSVWERDIPFLRELGVNAVRLYAVDASRNHDAFMCALQRAGIYVVVALAHDCPTCAVTRDEAPECYPKELKLQGRDVIDAFSKYSNTLAFSAGNEVNHVAPPGDPGWNAPCQKKFIADMRAYIRNCPGMRRIPVGLVVADSDRSANALYYDCGPSDGETAEWYGVNAYLNCDGERASYEQALGYKYLAREFKSFDYGIPVLLTEFGCLSPTFRDVGEFGSQRTFLQAKWMIEEPELRDVFGGGFAFEYSVERANGNAYPFKTFSLQGYGIGYFSPEQCNEVDTPCEYNPMPEFDFLKEAYTTAKDTLGVSKSEFEPEPNRVGRSECPEGMKDISEFEWDADRTKLGACPEVTEPFTCPGFRPAVVPADEPAESQGSSVPPAWIAAVVLLAAALAWYGRRMRPSEQLYAPSLSESKPHSSYGSLSDESEGLLSMKGVERGGAYQAMHSDSSSEEGSRNQ